MKPTAVTPKILLDLGGVVFGSIGVSNDLINWSIVSKLNYKYGHALNVGEIGIEVFLQDYNELTGQNLKPQAFLKAIFDTLVFNEELITYLQARFEIYILSDNYRENIEYISERYHFSNWAKAQFYSFDFRLTKQDPQIFTLVLEQLNSKASELIFIDDSPSKIANARKLGIPSICYKNNEQLFQEMEILLKNQ